MKLRDSILDYFYKRQKWIEAFAVFFIFLGVSFKFTSNKTEWIWASYPYVAVLIAGFSLVFIAIWLRLEKKRVQDSINYIQDNSDKIEKIDLLTNRQQQVFELILQNKTNKQISEELFIELSTLKTHINKIYKTLNIKNRKDVRKYKPKGVFHIAGS